MSVLARERSAVKPRGERDDRRALRVKARDLDGVLHRFRTGGEEDAFSSALARHQLVEALGQLHIALIRRDLKARVHQLSSCCATAAFTLGCTCPVLSTEMPLAKSM